MIDGETGDHMISTLVKSQDEVRLLLGNRLRFSIPETLTNVHQHTVLSSRVFFLPSCGLGSWGCHIYLACYALSRLDQ